MGQPTRPVVPVENPEARYWEELEKRRAIRSQERVAHMNMIAALRAEFEAETQKVTRRLFHVGTPRRKRT